MVVFVEDGHGGLGVRTKKMCINVGNNILKKLKKMVKEKILSPKNKKYMQNLAVNFTQEGISLKN